LSTCGAVRRESRRAPLPRALCFPVGKWRACRRSFSAAPSQSHARPVDFGNHAIFDDNVGGAIFPESIKYTTNILRVSINYRFGY
jgi:hypothetical protein